jgi:hypothetical protein
MLNQTVAELESDSCEIFIDFVYNALLQLAPAIDFTKRLLNAPGITLEAPDLPQNMSGFDLLAFDLASIAISFAYADGNIAREECVILAGLGHLMRDHTSRPFVELNFAAFKYVKEHNDWYVPLACLELITEYDYVFEADQSHLLRSLYYKFAVEVVDADRRQTPEENARLAEFKSLLYPLAEEEILGPQSEIYPVFANPHSIPLWQDENFQVGEPV